MKLLVNSLFILFILSFSTFGYTEGLDLACDAWPPYQIVDKQGNISGFSTEVVKEVFKQIKIPISSINAYPWKRAVYRLKAGRSHGLFSANYTKERAVFAWYPEESLIDSPWVIWVKSESEHVYSNFKDLTGKRVGVVSGYSYTPEFRRFIETHCLFDAVTSDETNFEKLNIGRLDFVVAELGNGLHIIRQKGYESIIPFREHPIKTDGLFIIFNKKKVTHDLVEKFSIALKTFKQGPMYRMLLQKYF